MNVDVSPNLKFRYKLLTQHMLSPGADQGGSWGSPPPFFFLGGGPPNFIKREKERCACACEYATY